MPVLFTPFDNKIVYYDSFYFMHKFYVCELKILSCVGIELSPYTLIFNHLE